MENSVFQQQLQQYYVKHRRELPWRTPALELDENDWLDPYLILLSEMMLQQTQVSRVVPKYERFIKELPTIAALASAPLSLVLELWSGLGYNRRAKYLHDAAKTLVDMSLPWHPADLISLKGIGPNTAGAICVYAFNQPHIFIETNIRSVYLYHFSKLREEEYGSDFTAGLDPAVKDEELSPILDRELIPLINKSLDHTNPREWYWALMDYGAYLKRTRPNPSRSSAHYTRQSAFTGSQRQLRGQVVRYLLAVRSTSKAQLANEFPDERLEGVLNALVREGLFTVKGTTLSVVAS
jgi:A/G-specific adenine glycosylase